MKKIYSLVVLMMLALTGCSSDDKSTVNNEAAVENTDRNLKVAGCPLANLPWNESVSAYSVLIGADLTFTWNGNVNGSSNIRYESFIEIQTNSSRNCDGFYTSSSFYSVDLFNNYSYLLSPGVASNCFRWRLSYSGYSKRTDELVCSSTTSWKTFQYRP